jgi:hypothetical protein
MAYNMPARTAEFATIASALACPVEPGATELDRAHSAVYRVAELLGSVGIPASLAELGLERDRLMIIGPLPKFHGTRDILAPCPEAEIRNFPFYVDGRELPLTDGMHPAPRTTSTGSVTASTPCPDGSTTGGQPVTTTIPPSLRCPLELAGEKGK